MKNNQYIQIIPGIYYEISTGLPYSDRRNTKFHLLDSRINDYGYRRVLIDGKAKLWHRIVYEYFNGKIPNGKFVDHKDNDRNNSRIDNLQLCTKKYNCRKQIKHKNNKSVYTGASFDKETGRYVAAITIDGKTKKLGRYNTAYEAHLVYMAEKKKIHGADSIAPLIEQSA